MPVKEILLLGLYIQSQMIFFKGISLSSEGAFLVEDKGSATSILVFLSIH